MSDTAITLDGKSYELLKTFDEGTRACITYDGLYAFVDLVDGVWQLSGVPARPGPEKDYFDALVAPLDGTTTVTVTRDA